MNEIMQVVRLLHSSNKVDEVELAQVAVGVYYESSWIQVDL
jgi:hypothetical protein